MTRLYLYPYRVGSRSARALADALGGKVLKREGSSFQLRPTRKVINWGSSTTPDRVGVTLNPASAVSRMGNKLAAFRLFSNPTGASQELQDGVTPLAGPRVPRWTESRQEALEWLSQGHKVVARTVLNGSSGSGIILVSPESPAELPEAPLYVEYIPKDAEFRVHLFRESPGGAYGVIDTQKKIRDPDKEPTNWQVRSHHNGFIFVRQGFVTPVDVLTQATRAIEVSGLDFGGVDVIWNQHRGRAYVLEVNTAVGLEGTTVTKYSEAVRRYFNLV